MVKGVRVAIAVALVLAVAGSIQAAENIIKFFERNRDQYISQGEWATYLVKAIGNEDKVRRPPPTSTSSRCSRRAASLRSRAGKRRSFLTYGAKAVTMVQALGLSDQLAADATALDYIWYSKAWVSRGGSD